MYMERMGSELTVRPSRTMFWMFAGLPESFLVSVSLCAWVSSLHTSFVGHVTCLTDLDVGHILHLSLSSRHSHLPQCTDWHVHSHLRTSAWNTSSQAICMADPPHPSRFHCQLPLPSHFLSEHLGDLHWTQGNQRVTTFPLLSYYFLFFMSTGVPLLWTPVVPVPRLETGTQHMCWTIHGVNGC